MNIWFAVDNIDLLEDTPNRQNTFHGTVIVINRRNVDGEPVNTLLVIPEKNSKQGAQSLDNSIISVSVKRSCLLGPQLVP